jgi:hypothetical protein
LSEDLNKVLNPTPFNIPISNSANVEARKPLDATLTLYPIYLSVVVFSTLSFKFTVKSWVFNNFPVKSTNKISSYKILYKD